jgi:predicted phage tail protein
MTSQLTSKLSALAFALLVNCMMIGGVAYLFSSQAHASTVYQAAQATQATRILAPAAMSAQV